MHFHDKDVVVTYLEDGVLASTTSDGQRVDNPHYFGYAKFNPRDRTHTETLVNGRGVHDAETRPLRTLGSVSVVTAVALLQRPAAAGRRSRVPRSGTRGRVFTTRLERTDPTPR